MSMYGPPTGPSVWQPPAPPNRPRRSRRAWIAGAAVGAAFAAALGGFLAASGSSTPQANAAASSPSSTSTTAPANGAPPQHRLLPRLGGEVLHGTYTVQTGNGRYRTYDVQVGKASGVSSSSITVTSADGFKHTYVVTPSTVVDAQRDGIASVAAGDQVRLVATVSGSTTTATDIVDTTKAGNGLPRMWGGFGKVPGMRGPNAPGAST